MRWWSSFPTPRLKTDFLRYDQTAEIVDTDQPLEITKGVQWLKGSAAEFNLGNSTGRIYDADGFTDEELFIKAKVLIKTGPDTYVVEDGLLTSCSDIIPKWSFHASRAKIHVDHRVTVRNPVLKAKKVPLFYLPYMTFPTGKKDRSSGFLIPSTGNSNRKGRSLTQSFYLVLGPSADVTFREDYFSKRGLGHGFTLRARPNAHSNLFLDGYTIDDRMGQGGTSLNGTGETRFGDYRFVADFNLVSNFVFRRVFSDSFFAATRPTEASHFFVTNNFGGGSFNLRLARQETVFLDQERGHPAHPFDLFRPGRAAHRTHSFLPGPANGGRGNQPRRSRNRNPGDHSTPGSETEHLRFDPDWSGTSNHTSNLIPRNLL